MTSAPVIFHRRETCASCGVGALVPVDYPIRRGYRCEGCLRLSRGKKYRVNMPPANAPRAEGNTL